MASSVQTPSQQLTSFIDVVNRILPSSSEIIRLRDQLMSQIRVCLPGLLEVDPNTNLAFDPVKQIVNVRLAILDNLLVDAISTPIEIPLLINVPVVMPRGGGFSVTLPLQENDEVLVIFGDRCIDSWWQSGGTENVQMRRRLHHLADGFAIPGPWSQPNTLDDYSGSTIQIRTDSGDTFVEVIEGNVNVQGNLNASTGASGSFTTPDGHKVTVINGIVVDIQ